MCTMLRSVLVVASCLLSIECVAQSRTQAGNAAQQASGNAAVGMATSHRYAADFFQSKHPRTAMDMVYLLPGFTFSAGDPTVRGYAEAAGNVLIDGQRPSTKQFTLDTVLQNITAGQVDYIEVIEGARPGLEMLGQTIVANVVTRRIASHNAVLALGNAFFLDGRNTPSGSIQISRQSSRGAQLTGAFAISRYVELAEGQGPQKRFDSTAGLLQAADVDAAAGGLTAYSYGVFSAPAWRGHASLNASAARTDYAYREDDLGSPPSSSKSIREYLGGPLGGQSLLEFGAHFNRPLGERWTSESVVLIDPSRQTYSSTATSPGDDERFRERQHGGEALGRTNLRFLATDRVTFESNVELAFNWLATTSRYSFNAAPVPLANAEANVSETRGQISGHIAWTLHKGIDLDLGAQYESSNIFAKADADRSKLLGYLKPKVALNLVPSSHLRIGARVEHEVGQLNFTNFVAVSSLSTGSVRAGNTDIIPQQDWVFEVVPEYHFWSEGDAVLTLRHYLINDAIDRVPISTGDDSNARLDDAPGNIGSGTEDMIQLNLTLPTSRVKLAHGLVKVAATRLLSSVTDPTTRQQRPITGLNPFEFSVLLRQDLPRWKADWGISFFSPCSASPTVKGCTEKQYRFNEIDSYRATPTLDVFAEYLPGRKLSLRLEVDNILQQRYSRVVALFAGPRDSFPLAYQEHRTLRSSASVSFSLRRSF